MSDTTNCLVCGKNIDVQVALYNTGKPNCCDNCAVERRGEYKLQEIKRDIEQKEKTIVATTVPSVAKFISDTKWLISQLEQAQATIKEYQEHSQVESNMYLDKMIEVNRLRTENERLKAANQKLVECLKTIKTYTRSTFQNEGNKLLRIEEVATEALSEVKGNG